MLDIEKVEFGRWRMIRSKEEYDTISNPRYAQYRYAGPGEYLEVEQRVGCDLGCYVSSHIDLVHPKEVFEFIKKEHERLTFLIRVVQKREWPR